MWSTLLFLHNFMKIDNLDERSSPPYKHSSPIKGKFLDEKLSLWWSSMALMKIHYFGENFVKMIELDNIMKIYHCDEFIIMMNIQDLKWITLVILGLYTNMINCTFLCLVVFGHFHTFLDGWVGWWGKSRLKTISAQLKLKLGLSLAIWML